MKRNIRWMAIALLALSASVALAQMRYIPNAPGTWKPWRFIAYPDNQRSVGRTAGGCEGGGSAVARG